MPLEDSGFPRPALQSHRSLRPQAIAPVLEGLLGLLCGDWTQPCGGGRNRDSGESAWIRQVAMQKMRQSQCPSRLGRNMVKKQVQRGQVTSPGPSPRGPGFCMSGPGAGLGSGETHVRHMPSGAPSLVGSRDKGSQGCLSPWKTSRRRCCLRTGLGRPGLSPASPCHIPPGKAKGTSSPSPAPLCLPGTP